MTETPLPNPSFHFQLLVRELFTAEAKCHQMELLHIFLIAEQSAHCSKKSDLIFFVYLFNLFWMFAAGYSA